MFKVIIVVSKQLDFIGIFVWDQVSVVFILNEEGKGGLVEIMGEVDDFMVEVIIKVVLIKECEEVMVMIQWYQIVVKVVKVFSQNGLVFSVLWLGVMEQGELEFVESGVIFLDFIWDLLVYFFDLISFKFNVDSKIFEVDLVDEKVSYILIDDDMNIYLLGFVKDCI